MKYQCRHKSDPRGFTLAEVLVALVIFSLAMVVVSGGIERGAAVWSRTQVKMSDAETLAAIGRVLGDLSLRAYPEATLAEDSTDRSASGSAQHFTFVAEFPAYPDRAGYYLVELRLVETEDGVDLVLRRQEASSGDTPAMSQASSRTSTIAVGLEQASFSFLERVRQTGAYQWGPSWDDPSSLPELMKVSLRLRGVDQELLIRFPGQISPQCAFHPNAAGCRPA